MGDIIKRDTCPEKYYKKSGFIKDTLPSIITIALISFFSGNFMHGAGLNNILTIVYDVVIFCFLYGFTYFIMNSSKKRLAQTFISVCENGVCGTYPVNGFKLGNFALRYNEITKVTTVKDKLILQADKKKITVFLKDTDATADLIRNKCPNLK